MIDLTLKTSDDLGRPSADAHRPDMRIDVEAWTSELSRRDVSRMIETLLRLAKTDDDRRFAEDMREKAAESNVHASHHIIAPCVMEQPEGRKICENIATDLVRRVVEVAVRPSVDGLLGGEARRFGPKGGAVMVQKP